MTEATTSGQETDTLNPHTDAVDDIVARVLGLSFGPGSILRYYQMQADARAAAKEAEAQALEPYKDGPRSEAATAASDTDFGKQFIAWVLGEGYAAGRVRSRRA